MFRTDNVREVLIKSGMQIAQAGFSFDCMKTTQEYLMYFKEFSCNKTENMQVRCVPRFIQRFLRQRRKTLLPCRENAVGENFYVWG